MVLVLFSQSFNSRMWCVFCLIVFVVVQGKTCS